MTTTYNPAEVERLISEARDSAQMLAAFREFGDSHLIRTKHGAYGTHAVVLALECLRAMADQLEAARVEMARRTEEWSNAEHRVDTLITELEAARARIAELEHDLATLRSSVVAAMSSAGPEVGENERAP